MQMTLLEGMFKYLLVHFSEDLLLCEPSAPSVTLLNIYIYLCCVFTGVAPTGTQISLRKVPQVINTVFIYLSI